MARDHFVSQVHLKQFSDPFPTGKLWACRKSDGKRFRPWPKDVCRAEDWNSNPYLPDPRYIEEFLKKIEPAYDRCLSEVRSEIVTVSTREVFSAFFAFLVTHTPTALRLLEVPVRSMLANVARKGSQTGELPAFSIADDHPWNGKSVEELLHEGEIFFKIDPRAPQAMATANYVRIAQVYARCDWTIVAADASTGYFLTSDHPSTILTHVEGKYAWRTFPISPDRAVIVKTDTGYADKERTALNGFVDPKKQSVRIINDVIVKSAEDIVFYGAESSWAPDFIQKRSSWRVEMASVSSGPLQLHQERLVSQGA